MSRYPPCLHGFMSGKLRTKHKSKSRLPISRVAMPTARASWKLCGRSEVPDAPSHQQHLPAVAGWTAPSASAALPRTRHGGPWWAAEARFPRRP